MNECMNSMVLRIDLITLKIVKDPDEAFQLGAREGDLPSVSFESCADIPFTTRSDTGLQEELISFEKWWGQVALKMNIGVFEGLFNNARPFANCRRTLFIAGLNGRKISQGCIEMRNVAKDNNFDLTKRPTRIIRTSFSKPLFIQIMLSEAQS